MTCAGRALLHPLIFEPFRSGCASLRFLVQAASRSQAPSHCPGRHSWQMAWARQQKQQHLEQWHQQQRRLSPLLSRRMWSPWHRANPPLGSSSSSKGVQHRRMTATTVLPWLPWLRTRLMWRRSRAPPSCSTSSPLLHRPRQQGQQQRQRRQRSSRGPCNRRRRSSAQRSSRHQHCRCHRLQTTMWWT